MMNAFYTKANTIDVNAALAFKANSVDVYTKTQSDAALLLKSNATDVNTALALKINTADFSNVANTKPSDLPVFNCYDYNDSGGQRTTN